MKIRTETTLLDMSTNEPISYQNVIFKLKNEYGGEWITGITKDDFIETESETYAFESIESYFYTDTLIDSIEEYYETKKLKHDVMFQIKGDWRSGKILQKDTNHCRIVTDNKDYSIEEIDNWMYIDDLIKDYILR